MGVPRGERRQPVLGRRRAARRRDVEPAMGPVGRRVAPGDELDTGPGLGECDRGGHPARPAPMTTTSADGIVDLRFGLGLGLAGRRQQPDSEHALRRAPP